MVFIPLKNRNNAVVAHAKVDDEDGDWLSQWEWRYSQGYARRSEGLNGRTNTIWMHRQIMGFPTANVDHEDHDGLNNQRQNLRVATHGENQANRRRSLPKSGYRGVYIVRGGYQPVVTIDGVRHYLPWTKDPIEAALRYDAATRELHGEFATLNFPEHVIATKSPPTLAGG